MEQTPAYSYPYEEFREDFARLLEPEPGKEADKMLFQRVPDYEKAAWMWRRLEHAMYHMQDLLDHDSRFGHFRVEGKTDLISETLILAMWRTSAALPDQLLGMRVHPEKILRLIAKDSGNGRASRTAG